jgi:hypothetical protein
VPPSITSGFPCTAHTPERAPQPKGPLSPHSAHTPRAALTLPVPPGFPLTRGPIPATLDQVDPPRVKCPTPFSPLDGLLFSLINHTVSSLWALLQPAVPLPGAPLPPPSDISACHHPSPSPSRTSGAPSHLLLLCALCLPWWWSMHELTYGDYTWPEKLHASPLT